MPIRSRSLNVLTTQFLFILVTFTIGFGLARFLFKYQPPLSIDVISGAVSGLVYGAFLLCLRSNRDELGTQALYGPFVIGTTLGCVGAKIIVHMLYAVVMGT